MRSLKLIIILFISFCLFVLIDFFLGKQIINYLFSDNKPIIKNAIYHHDREKNVNERKIYNKVSSYNLCTNNYGFKSNCKKKKIISKKIDYAFIGDSFTEGVGLNYEDTFVGLFSNDYKDKIVVNLGVESYSPKIYFKKIEYLIN